MASNGKRSSIIRWTRGCAALLMIHASLTAVLAFMVLPPIRQVTEQAIPILTREGSLIFAALLLVSGLALWQLQRWGLILLVTAVLIFSVPLALSDLSFVDRNTLQSFKSAFSALGPVCIPYTLLAVLIYAFWRVLGEIE